MLPATRAINTGSTIANSTAALPDVLLSRFRRADQNFWIMGDSSLRHHDPLCLHRYRPGPAPRRDHARAVGIRAAEICSGAQRYGLCDKDDAALVEGVP